MNTPKKRTLPRSAPTPMTDKQIRAAIDRVESVQANRVLDDDLKAQLIAVNMTLRMVRGEQNYINEWLSRAEWQVWERHKMTHAGKDKACDCSVCRRYIKR